MGEVLSECGRIVDLWHSITIPRWMPGGWGGEDLALLALLALLLVDQRGF